MEKLSNTPTFTTPEIGKERGEVQRVAQDVFNIHEPEEIRQFGARFLEAAKTAELVNLSEEMWSQLENTDSYTIPPQGWSAVEESAVAGHPDHPRDWQNFKKLYEQGASIEAPIVLKTKSVLHLVAGNTRLMVARALRVTPRVLLVELEEAT